MSGETGGTDGIGEAFVGWAAANRGLRDAVARLTAEQLALHPNGDAARWPLWATIGHLGCSRVFWLCDVAGEPGAAETPFPNASWDCPGDDDLEHVLDAPQLVAALDVTFAIVERALATWTPAMLLEEVRHPEWPASDPSHTRGWVLSRVFMHDVWHAAEVNETLTAAGIAPIEPWA